MTNSYQFDIIDFGGFYFRPLKLEMVPENNFERDKILSFSKNSICVRNNNKLLFGSLKLEPKSKEYLTPRMYNLNLHKYLLLNHYSFEFFTVEAIYYLLKTDRKYTLYQILFDSKIKFERILEKQSKSGEIDEHNLTFEENEFSKRDINEINDSKERILRDTVIPGMQRASTISPQSTSKLVVNFVPTRLEQIINLTQKEFYEQNKIENDSHFLNVLEELYQNVNESNSSTTFLTMLKESYFVINALETKKANFDETSRFVFLVLLEEDYKNKQNRSSKNEEATSSKQISINLTSEIIFNAAISEQQDFLVKMFMGEREVESWKEMSSIGMAYWYEDLGKMKSILDRDWMNEYKTSKDTWKVLFWVVILGKPKVLAGLFKLQPDSQKFVNFFNEDFSKESAKTKSVNNAFLLRSKKRFLDSAAFFILAKNFREALEIILESEKDLQLAVLVYRIYENEIKEYPECVAYFKATVQEKFMDQAIKIGDDFIAAIGHFILRDFESVVKQVVNYKAGDSVIRNLNNFQDVYGFIPVSFSLSIETLRAFLEKNGRYKAFFSQHNPISNIVRPDEIDDMFSSVKKTPLIKAPIRNNLFLLDDDEEEVIKPISKINETAKIEKPDISLTEKDKKNDLTSENLKEFHRLRFFANNQKHFLALLEMISLKSKHPTLFPKICEENRHLIKHNITEIMYKKLSKLIKSQAYSKTSLIKNNVWEISTYFGVDPSKVFSKIIERAKLFCDDALNLSILSCAKNESQMLVYLNELLERTTTKCFSIIKKGQFIFLDACYWMKKIHFVLDVISTLKNVSCFQLETIGQEFVNSLTQFNEILNALIKLIMIRSMCFDETIELLEIKTDLPVIYNNFSKFVITMEEKIMKMYPFSIRKNDDYEEEIYKNNAIEIDPSKISEANASKNQKMSIKITEALENHDPDNDKNVRDLFLKMNQLSITSKLNTIISDLGFGDFYSSSNLCLQLLFELLYLSTFFFAADSNKAIYIKKIDFCFESIFFESLKNFILLISYSELDESLQLLTELQNVLENSNTFLSRGSFMHIQPVISLNMAFNKKFIVNENSTRKLSKFLEDLKIFLIFQHDIGSLADHQKKVVQTEFGKGIQIFKPKIEVANIFQKKLFRKIVNFSTASAEEIFVLIEQKVRKIFLFTNLFKGKRSNEYFSLIHLVRL